MEKYNLEEIKKWLTMVQNCTFYGIRPSVRATKYFKWLINEVERLEQQILNDTDFRELKKEYEFMMAERNAYYADLEKTEAEVERLKRQLTADCKTLHIHAKNAEKQYALRRKAEDEIKRLKELLEQVDIAIAKSTRQECAEIVDRKLKGYGLADEDSAFAREIVLAHKDIKKAILNTGKE